MPSPHVRVAVLNYNGRDLLDLAIPTLLAQRYDSFDVVVVDNGSADGSAQHVRERWPGVEVVALEENVGVTAALNVMVAGARDSEFVALLNNDVELDPEWLARLVAVLLADPRAAAAAGKLLRPSPGDVIDRAGDEVHWSSACYGRGAGETDRGQFDRPQEVFSVGGAAALYRRAAFDAVGPFDEDFFAYVEDVDWGFRARLAGWTARYEPAAVGVHRGGATLGDITPFSLYHLRRNQLWLVLKNYPAASLLRHAPEVLAFNAHALAMAVRKGHLRIVGRAWRDAVLGLPRLVRKRRAVQRTRRIAAGQLEPLLGSHATPG